MGSTRLVFLWLLIAGAAFGLLGGLASESAPGASAASAIAGASPCSLVSTVGDLSEGPTDPVLNPSAVGEVRAVMLYVDFQDAPESTDTDDIYTLYVPFAETWYDEVSYGRMTLAVDSVDRWYRMPQRSDAYGLDSRNITFEQQRAYLADAIEQADPDVDFSAYDVVYVVPSIGVAKHTSFAFNTYPGFGVPVDGVEVRNAVTFGERLELLENYDAKALIHETGHMLGLPDLYDYSGTTKVESAQWAGTWDMMSSLEPGNSFLAWHRHKLGWIDDEDMVCLTSGQQTETLRSLHEADGLRLAVLPTSASTAYVVEVRKATGMDAALCETGVLIYEVDASVSSGEGPVVVSEAAMDYDPDKEFTCGRLHQAPYDIGPGEVASFSDPGAGVSVNVLSTDGEAYTVELSNDFVPTPPPPAPLNDDFGDAVNVDSLPFTRTLSTASSTTEPGEPFSLPECPMYLGATVWYRVDPPTTGYLNLDTLGSDYDTTLAVYTGSSVDALILVACNDDGGGSFGLASRLARVPVSAGTTYYVQAGGFARELGSCN